METVKNEKGQKKDKQWDAKHYTETRYWATRTPLKTGVNFGFPKVCTVPVPLVPPSCNSCYKTGHTSWTREGSKTTRIQKPLILGSKFVQTSYHNNDQSHFHIFCIAFYLGTPRFGANRTLNINFCHTKSWLHKNPSFQVKLNILITSIVLYISNFCIVPPNQYYTCVFIMIIWAAMFSMAVIDTLWTKLFPILS